MPVRGGVPVLFGGGCARRHRLILRLHKPSAPIPPTPFPAGEGGDFCYLFARGEAPCNSAVVPGAARRAGRFAVSEGNCPGSLSLPRPGGRGPSQAPPSLQRRMVPSPPDPPTLLGCSLPGRERKLFGSKWVPSPVSRKVTGTRAASGVSLECRKPPGKPCRFRRRCRGAGGDSPRQSKAEVSPFPGGEGGRGDGGKSDLHGGQGRADNACTPVVKKT